MLAAGAIFIGAFLVAVAIIALALPRLRRLAGLQHIRQVEAGLVGHEVADQCRKRILR